MYSQLDGLQWVLLALIPLIFLQRALHREMQAVFLLLTRRVDIALVIFSMIFLPGVLLHEASHYLMAKILRVRTGRFSLIPQRLGDGRLLLGYVETAPTDILRDALIGAAPLMTGGLFVAYAGRTRLGLLSLWDALSSLDLATAIDGFSFVHDRPDFWLWFYLIVTVSSTMLPSSTDRRAWLPLIVVVALLLGLGILVGVGPWMLENIAPPVNEALRASAVVLAMSAAIHLVVLIPTLFTRRVLSRIFRLEVV
ncbi:MAG: hypothetical protein ISS57_09055 [Anaerolineales bacterium]|nr:hypothetical protein [Anaerolineales bacterium]